MPMSLETQFGPRMLGTLWAGVSRYLVLLPGLITCVLVGFIAGVSFGLHQSARPGNLNTPSPINPAPRSRSDLEAEAMRALTSLQDTSSPISRNGYIDVRNSADQPESSPLQIE